MKKLVDEGLQRAREILEAHRPALDAISQKLFEVETLERAEYEALLKEQGVEIKDVYRDEAEQERKELEALKTKEEGE